MAQKEQIQERYGSIPRGNSSNSYRIIFLTLLVTWVIFTPFNGYGIPPKKITALIHSFKKDARGPYQAIRWFCPDGTVLPPQQHCSQPGGVQHALPRDIVVQIARQNHIFLGQILAGTPFTDFWDSTRQNSRAIQYQLEKYLREIDDGWILRRARFYRGAFQVEDETQWGRNFLLWLVKNDKLLREQFFLIRQLSKDIPHGTHENRWQRVRALSKSLADAYPPFMKLRIKLHGKPDPGDLERLERFRQQHLPHLTLPLLEKLDSLIAGVETVYRDSKLSALNQYLSCLSIRNPIRKRLADLLNPGDELLSPQGTITALTSSQFIELSRLLREIRTNLFSALTPEERLCLIDLSNEIEGILIRGMPARVPATLGSALFKGNVLLDGAVGCGYLEEWEGKTLRHRLEIISRDDSLSQSQVGELVRVHRQAVKWGSEMFRAVYQPDVNRFTEFEPLTAGFIADRIRSSLMLPFGEMVNLILDQHLKVTGVQNEILDLPQRQYAVGVNPGIAAGKLVVVSGRRDTITYSPKKIYVLPNAPPDLKPVAGILTVSEGNLVSHVQLLARNLGIPNVMISRELLSALKRYSGMSVFLAVTPRGRVILKLLSRISGKEQRLLSSTKKRLEKIRVPLNRLALDSTDFASLTHLRAYHSGILCGPKAANLGELKTLFPGYVSNGFIIPFGEFRRQLEQPMPGKSITYWQFLRETFKLLKTTGDDSNATNLPRAHLARLDTLYQAIRHIQFLPGFQEKLRQRFREVFGRQLGELPVFIRSDTNMEDLPNFTGAGLNLTVFNVLAPDSIFQALRDVWASPYRERSFRWRNRYLINPEDVYPSVLILPSVNVEKSGVVLTTSLGEGDSTDMTIAFNRGVGGAVEGQSAETYLLRSTGENVLLRPSRQRSYHWLPDTGGVAERMAAFNQPVLTAEDIAGIRRIASIIKKTFALQQQKLTSHPLDIELGIKHGHIWLFQIRPFVQNKSSEISAYLQSLDMPPSSGKKISLHQGLE